MSTLRCPERTEFTYDIDSQDHMLYKNRDALILRVCIGAQHLKDQHFDDNMLDAALRIRANPPKNYHELWQNYRLDQYGITHDDTRGGFWNYSRPIPVKEFWQGVLNVLTGKSFVQVKLLNGVIEEWSSDIWLQNPQELPLLRYMMYR